MSQAIIVKSGGGGITSDDVTATKNQVLQGVTALTSDSDDEVVEGTIPNRGHRGANTDNFSEVSSFGGYVVGFAEGYYESEDGRQPYVVVPTATVKQAVGYNPDKTLNDTVTCGERGTIVNRGNIVDTVSFENAHWSSKYLARMEQGYYSQNGQWKPCVAIPYSVLSNVIGVDTTKMLQSLTLAGKQGQIKTVDTQAENYKANMSTNYGIDTWNNHTFWMDFPHGNAYYYRADGHPHCCIPAEALGTAQADSILEGQTATSQYGVKFAGTIPRWIASHGDVIIANSSHSGQGFTYDLPGVGRGIAVGIKNGSFIQGANYVFLPAPYVLSENIREGVNMFGVHGGLPDYRIGRPVFDGATFNALYVGGVANKDFPEARIYRDRTQSHNKYARYIGGTTINVSAGSDFHLWSNGLYVGFVLDRAILFTFFRQLKITYKLDIRMYTGRYNRLAGVMVYVNLYDAENRSRLLGGRHEMHSSSERVGSTYNGDTYEMIIDTSSINKDAFVALCANAYSDDNMSSAVGNITFTKIELIN
nr:MAG TPA: hypothetical protein [Caudoviricetes sp.]